MEEVAENLTQDDVLEIMIDFPITPLTNKMIISVNAEEGEDLMSTGFDVTQFVIAVGSRVPKEIVPGCRVMLDLERMTIPGENGMGSVQLKPVEVNGRVYAMIADSFIDAIDNR